MGAFEKKWYRTLYSVLLCADSQTMLGVMLSADTGMSQCQDIAGLVQDCCISSANALEILQSRPKPRYVREWHLNCSTIEVMTYMSRGHEEFSMDSDPKGCLITPEIFWQQYIKIIENIFTVLILNFITRFSLSYFWNSCIAELCTITVNFHSLGFPYHFRIHWHFILLFSNWNIAQMPQTTTIGVILFVFMWMFSTCQEKYTRVTFYR